MSNSSINLPALERACSEARGLSMDAVAKAASGHLGLPLGATEVGAALFEITLSCLLDMVQCSCILGYIYLVTISPWRISRTLDNTSQRPQVTQSSSIPQVLRPPLVHLDKVLVMVLVLLPPVRWLLPSKFNTAEHKIFDQKVVVLCGDGCLQEGIAQEALSFAGHHRLDNFILFYDSNDVTLDAMAVETQSEDAVKRFEALGFDVQLVANGNSIPDLVAAYEAARNATSNKPQAIICKTLIAKGIPEVAGTNKGHGEAGVKFIDVARKNLGLPEEKFFVSADTRTYFDAHKKSLLEAYTQWESIFGQWKAANPQLATLLDSADKFATPCELLSNIPEFDAKVSIATRKAGADVLQPLAKALPLVVSGSADLHGSTLNYIKDGQDFTPACLSGRNLKFGIREHAMGAMLNGFAYHGIFQASGATFLVFSDYLRPSIRLAALSHLPVVYIFTHDSIGVGEDGPTHQPVETVSGLRMIPNLHVIRPADPEETAGAFASALSRKNGPTLLSLTRQNLPNLTCADVKVRREGVLKGGYILVKETAPLSLILIATGSEVQHAVEAAKQIGAGVRVVSMPCTEIYDAQTCEYKEEVLPLSCRKRIAIEAGVTSFWYKYVGLDGKVIGIDRFGFSAPGAIVQKELGMCPDSIVKASQQL
uniref:Transketolase n=1 Tax=Synstelium polycarpum TaxID=361085 RepID=A0A1L2FUX3_9MYCE|nr:transketolase [Synstelium polycarpum]